MTRGSPLVRLAPAVGIAVLGCLIGCGSESSGSEGSGGDPPAGVGGDSAASTGGSPGLAGQSNAGGSPGLADQSNTGGLPGTGGLTADGGTPSTGGTSPVGGAPSTGGSGAAAGSVSTGGSSLTGGSTAAAGAAGDAGATAVGGSSAAGGATGGAAGSPGTGAAAGLGGAVNDYPFCNYGAVPQGTAASFNESPSLVTFDSWPGGTSRTISAGYIALQMGPSQPAELPDSTINSVLTRVNDDLRYIVGTLGLHLPGWADRYLLDYFLLGSGLPNDDTPTTNTPESGYSGWRGGHPDVETTYHAMTRDANRWNLTHEFVHVLQNGYGTIAGELASWVHEAHNNYAILRLQQYVNGTIGSPSTVGWLDPLALEGSYLPIESCGMLADGSAVGPNQYRETNWEGDFGGYRYSCLFPLFVAQRVSPGFFNALWEQATSDETVLQTMVCLIGEDAVQCMVQEYGARNAIADYLEFSSDLQRQTSVGFGSWFYTDTIDQDGWLVPSDPVRLPRHTGRNNIPISVSAGASEVAVEFAPDSTGSAGSASELVAQIVYRAEDGSAVFSPPVTSGTTSIPLSLPPANDVVVVVVTSVKLDGYNNAESYGWDPDETFGYQIRVTGGSAAPTDAKYF